MFWCRFLYNFYTNLLLYLIRVPFPFFFFFFSLYCIFPFFFLFPSFCHLCVRGTEKKMKGRVVLFPKVTQTQNSITYAFNFILFSILSLSFVVIVALFRPFIHLKHFEGITPCVYLSFAINTRKKHIYVFILLNYTFHFYPPY